MERLSCYYFALTLPSNYLFSFYMYVCPSDFYPNINQYRFVIKLSYWNDYVNKFAQNLSKEFLQYFNSSSAISNCSKYMYLLPYRWNFHKTPRTNPFGVAFSRFYDYSIRLTDWYSTDIYICIFFNMNFRNKIEAQSQSLRWCKLDNNKSVLSYFDTQLIVS